MANYTKYRYNNTDVYVAEQGNLKVGLGQTNKLYTLKNIYFGDNKPKVAINCSYFNASGSLFVCGRNQGDTYQGCPDAASAGWQLVMDSSGVWHLGQFESWDYTKSDAGFTVGSVLIQDGEEVNIVNSIVAASNKINALDPQTAIAITNDNKAIFIICDGRTSSNAGLSGKTLRTFIKSKYSNIKYLCQLDGGGSSEMVVDGVTINKPSDGKSRAMLNGLCFYGDDESTPEPTPTPTPEPESKPEPEKVQRAILAFDIDGKDLLSGITQKEGIGTHVANFANDLNGHNGTDKCYIKAPYDCVVKGISTYDNTVFFESVGRVETPAGTFDHCFFMGTHMLDADFKALGITKGKVFKQGQKCYREGTKGNAAGNHIHFECGTGKYNGSGAAYSWKGKYYTYNGTRYKLYEPCTDGAERHIYDMFFLNNITDSVSNIKNVYPNKWKLSDAPKMLPTTVDRNKFKDQVLVSVDNLRVRSTPDTSISTNILGYCPQGYLNVAKKLDGWFKVDDGEFYIANLADCVEYFEGIKWEKPELVERNTLVNQVEVTADKLRIRTSPDTSSSDNIAGYCEQGFYNVVNIIVNDNYTWYQLNNYSYIAGVADSVRYLPKTEENSSADLKKEITALKAEVTRLTNQLKAVSSDYEDVTKKYEKASKELEEAKIELVAAKEQRDAFEDQLDEKQTLIDQTKEYLDKLNNLYK